MIEQLRSNVELSAENLRIFSGLKLLHIKREVEKLLSHIGDYGFFMEYTKHDISHIEEMQKIVEWLIPEHTQRIMTSAEWMMLVLSIYFHDMGMLITNDEFKKEKILIILLTKKVYMTLNMVEIICRKRRDWEKKRMYFYIRSM